MKEYDRVELISDKKRYRDEGLKRGDQGTILGPKRAGMWLVYFDGEIFQDEDGVWCTTEIDSGVYEEDLKVIEESDWDGTHIVSVCQGDEVTVEYHGKGWNEDLERVLTPEEEELLNKLTENDKKYDDEE